MESFIQHEASDIHLKVGCPPAFRVGGRVLYSKLPPMTEEGVRRLASKMMTERQELQYKKKGQVDFSYEDRLPSQKLIRARVNIFSQKGQTSMALKRVANEVRSLEELGLEDALGKLCHKRRGIILISGRAGSGKSTTMASTVDFINSKFHYHIITLEDPIEFIYTDKKSIISQREVKLDIESFKEGVQEAVRQDPDVIVLGEMLDLETMQAAITAAETGHLVISTIHTKTAAQTIHRIIDGVPIDSREMIRMQLANSLLGVVSQRLIPSKNDPSKLVMACEILVNSPSVGKAIFDSRVDKIEEIMEFSDFYGMQTLNQNLEKLCKKGMITEKVAIQSSYRPEDLALMLSDISRTSKKDGSGNTEWQHPEFREENLSGVKPKGPTLVELDDEVTESKKKKKA